ncbi:DUF6786 family protein [Carboxylicivirga taeanensis]|uniref:DUF6786 family protein n=1 Tax=Carboxylicivirga taeanensis TaxID=1416875 RepID=UPI003F6E157E
MKKGTLGYDKQFLTKYYKTIELKDDGATVLIVPDLQGRVMTSGCEGDGGFSFGWINYELIKSKRKLAHFNPFGGEERFWIGPEGGQYSVYFESEENFEFENWYVPSAIDTEPFILERSSQKEATFSKEIQLINYSGTPFHLKVERTVSLLNKKQVFNRLGLQNNNAAVVAYRSDNTIQNTGNFDWEKKSGLLSIWMLGMFTPSPEVTVAIPVKTGEEFLLGPKVNDNYFGEISNDRLKVIDDVVYFKADGRSRGKIGIPPLRANQFMGSYDAQNQTLTILECQLPEQVTDYVNSAWEIQETPYGGDAFNSYNDGPLEDGTQMGPFYELETSSPALDLKTQESYTHTQHTYHFKGTKKALNQISEKVLGVSIQTLEGVF